MWDPAIEVYLISTRFLKILLENKITHLIQLEIDDILSVNSRIKSFDVYLLHK